MSLKIISLPVISYCEIPQELTEDSWISENSPDSYVIYSMQELEHLRSPMDNWIWEEYPELRESERFFIHIDY